MHWLLQVAVLVLGIFHLPLGTALVLLDGWFHFTADRATLRRESPDWIVARSMGCNGFSEGVHKAIGAALLLSSVAVIHILYTQYRAHGNAPPHAAFLDAYAAYVVPITLFIIAAAVVLQQLAGRAAGVAFFP